MKTTSRFIFWAVATMLIANYSVHASPREFHPEIMYSSQWYWLQPQANRIIDPYSHFSMSNWPTSPDARRAMESMMQRKLAERERLRRENESVFIRSTPVRRASNVSQYHGW